MGSKLLGSIKTDLRLYTRFPATPMMATAATSTPSNHFLYACGLKSLSKEQSSSSSRSEEEEEEEDEDELVAFDMTAGSGSSSEDIFGSWYQCPVFPEMFFFSLSLFPPPPPCRAPFPSVSSCVEASTVPLPTGLLRTWQWHVLMVVVPEHSAQLKHLILSSRHTQKKAERNCPPKYQISHPLPPPTPKKKLSNDDALFVSLPLEIARIVKCRVTRQSVI